MALSRDAAREEYLQRARDDEPSLRIVVRDCSAPIPSHKEVLRLACSCVKNMPPGDVWDLRTLLINGHPVTEALVIDWLQVIYRSFDYSQPNFGSFTDTDIYNLLSFADAVGSTLPIIEAIADLLTDADDSSGLVIAADDSTHVTMKLGDMFHINDLELRLLRHPGVNPVLHTFSAPAELAAFRTALCSALERWLVAAYRLGLVKLQQALHAFVRNCSAMLPPYSVLNWADVLNYVFTDEVMSEVPPAELRGVWAARCSSLQLAGAGLLPALRARSDTAKIQADVVADDVYGWQAGEAVTLSFDLRLGRLKIDNATCSTTTSFMMQCLPQGADSTMLGIQSARR